MKEDVPLLLLLILVTVVSGQRIPKTLKVVSILNDPFLEQTANDTEDAKDKPFKGFIVDLLDEITGKMDGVDYEIILSEDGKYGAFDLETGSWNGMIGMLQKGKADLVAADLTMTMERLEIVDFSRPFMSAPLTILTKRDPRPTTSSGMFNFFQPFSAEVWVYFVLAYFVTSVTLWLVARITPYEVKPKVPVYTLTNSAWFIFSSVFRGSNITPQAFSTRLLAAGWWVFAMAIFAAYATTLKSFIVTSFEPSAFHIATDPQELLHKSNFRFAVIAGGSSFAFLNKSESATHSAIFNRIMEDPEENLLTSMELGVEKLVHPDTNDFGIIAEGNVADYTKGRHCDLYSVGHLNDRTFGFGFQKNNQEAAYFRDAFDAILLQLVESGRLHMLKERWWDAKKRCVGEQMATSITDGTCKEMAFILGTRQMAWPFIVLAMALVLSLFLSFAELIFHVMNAPTPPANSDVSTCQLFCKALKEAFCGCCAPPPPPPQQQHQHQIPKTSVSVTQA